ncbi:type III pantothenate kinase [bacterium]|nr:type III pantothenate kinase [bacterium]
MILISDIGNTSITVGLFNKDKKVKTWRLTTDSKRSADEYGILLSELMKQFNPNIQIEGAIISSVVTTLTDIYLSAIKKYLNVEPINFSYKIDTGVKIAIDNKSEVGADRIVNAVAAVNFYKTPAIVIDFGTATTFDIINEKNEFVGGIITPGMKIQAQALSKFTSKLPLLDIEAPKQVIGTTTQEAILSGIVRGHACMISGLLKECEKELKQKPVIIATGGYAYLVEKYITPKFDYIDEDLTLKGLNVIYNKLTLLKQ